MEQPRTQAGGRQGVEIQAGRSRLQDDVQLSAVEGVDRFTAHALDNAGYETVGPLRAVYRDEGTLTGINGVGPDRETRLLAIIENDGDSGAPDIEGALAESAKANAVLLATVRNRWPGAYVTATDSSSLGADIVIVTHNGRRYLRRRWQISNNGRVRDDTTAKLTCVRLHHGKVGQADGRFVVMAPGQEHQVLAGRA